MPLHFLDFFGLDHHHHDDVHLGGGHHDDIHLYRLDDGHVHRHHEDVHASFLSSPSTCRGPLRHTVGEDLTASSFAHGTMATTVRAQQASAFLDSGMSDFVSGHRASASSFLSIQERIVDAVQSTPPAVLVPLHALSIVGAVPGHIAFELGEGFMFGFQKGFALALTGKLIGSAAAFGIGRSALTCGCLKDRLMGMMDKWPLSKKVAKGVENGGGVSVFVIRMAPVPCVVKNYSLALLTEIPFTTYLVASFAGLVPTTAAHVYAGTLYPSAVALASGHGHVSATQAVALATPVVAGVLLTTLAGYYLHKHVLVDDEESEEKQADKIELELDALAKRKKA